MAVFWDTSRPDNAELLAWTAGQTNWIDPATGRSRDFISTDNAMAALAFSRQHPDDIGPEVLEAYWAGCNIHRWAICQHVFEALLYELPVEEMDSFLWVKGAILDAFDSFRGVGCPAGANRARRFGVRKQDYLVVRGLAEKILIGFEGHARGRWEQAHGS